jgi:hypothetical protein
VADARPRVIAVEAGVAAAFYVANTRWWPPFCPVIDWVAAAVLVVLIAAVDFHHWANASSSGGRRTGNAARCR